MSERAPLPPEKIARAWRRAKALYHGPTVRDPEPGEADGGARFSFRENRTVLDEAALARRADASGRELDACLDDLLAVTLGHYMLFPRRLLSALFLAKALRDVLGDEVDARALSLAFEGFAELAVAISAQRRPELGTKVLGALGDAAACAAGSARGRVLDAVLGVARHAAGEAESCPEAFRGLAELGLENAARDVEVLRTGALVFADALASIDAFGVEEEGGAPGGGPAGGSGGGPGRHLLSEITHAGRRQIDDALAELSLSLTRAELREVERTLRELQESEGGGGVLGDGSRSYGVGTSAGQLVVRREAIEFYRRLARAHPIAIDRAPLPSPRPVTSFGAVERWRMGSDPNLMIPSSSGGRILPGLTQKVRIVTRPRKTRRWRLPHALLAVDSSASMPDPDAATSVLVLASFCAALSYFKLGAALGVVNFSRDSFFLPFTRRLEDVFAALVAYQGGGTLLDTGLIHEMLTGQSAKLRQREAKQSLGALMDRPLAVPGETPKGRSREPAQTPVDLLLFSDLAIGNLEELGELVAKLDGLHRVVVISDSPAPPGTLPPGVTVFGGLRKAEDIVRITVGEVQASLAGR